MVERHVIADNRCFPYHDASTVINKKPATNRRSRMNVYIRHSASEPREETGREPKTVQPKSMRDAMPNHRVNARVSEQCFQCIPRRGIARAHTS
jgi:hypothetical protein